MLISIAISPECFGPDAIKDIESKEAAEAVLAALQNNSVLLCDSESAWLDRLRASVLALNKSNLRLGQAIQIRVEELLKQQRLSSISLGKNFRCQEAERIRRIAKALNADIAIGATASETTNLRALVKEGVEVCALGDYSNSDTEYKRRIWVEPQDLNAMDGFLAASVVGRAVKYSKTIEFIDPHIGKRGREGRQTRELKRTAEAILYVAEQWSDSSPYHSGDGVDVLIVTRGGDVGAGGFVDPSKARKAISLALKDCDRAEIIRTSKVFFKQDVSPSRFRARFIRAGQHCWSIGHEISDLARLRKPAGERGDLFIEQDCKLFRKLVVDISELPDA